MRMFTQGHAYPAFLLVLTLAATGPPLQSQEKEATQIGPSHSFGEIFGRITITAPAGDDHGGRPDPLLLRYSHHGMHAADSMGNPTGGVASKASAKTVVYLESQGSNSGQYALPDNHPILDQRGLQFHPRVLPVLVGTTVDFPNRDNLFHNVFSYSRAKTFDLGRYPTGESRSVTFDKPGVVRVYCDIHSDMNAVILVLSNPYFVSPDEQGRYALSQIPPGIYTLVVWFDRDILDRRKVEIRAGESVEVNFSH